MGGDHDNIGPILGGEFRQGISRISMEKRGFDPHSAPVLRLTEDLFQVLPGIIGMFFIYLFELFFIEDIIGHRRAEGLHDPGENHPLGLRTFHKGFHVGKNAFRQLGTIQRNQNRAVHISLLCFKNYFKIRWKSKAYPKNLTFSFLDAFAEEKGHAFSEFPPQ
jgi:hypothetical protein